MLIVHVIPKPNEQQGLGVGWPATQPAKEELAKIHEQIKGRLEKLEPAHVLSESTQHSTELVEDLCSYQRLDCVNITTQFVVPRKAVQVYKW